MITIRFGFIGAGKVGFSLGKYLKEKNINVSGYYSNNINSAKEAAIFTNTNYYNDLRDIIKDSDTIFITTPDQEIQKVWNEIKKLPINNKLICHCSGSISSEIFSDINCHGAYCYSIHPMFAVSSKYNSYKDFQKAFITIEGDKKHRQFLKDFFKSLGNDCEIISKENKSLYHISCVMVSNLVLGLINNGVQYLEKCGFEKEMAIKALFPLIEFNLKNIKDTGIVNSLTGPVERGDLGTIIKHCNALNEEERELYKLLSKNILNIAIKKNQNRDYKEIQKYLEE